MAKDGESNEPVIAAAATKVTGQRACRRQSTSKFSPPHSKVNRRSTAFDDSNTRTTLPNRGEPAGFGRVTTRQWPAVRRDNRKDLDNHLRQAGAAG